LDTLPEQILKTRNLTKRYGHFTAVNDLSFSLQKGDIYGLIGKNGAGKTTLLKMVSGLTAPASGEMELFGQTSESGLNRVRSRTGCMIESPSFFPYLSAAENLEYYRIQRGIQGKKRIQEILRLVGLSNTGKKKFKSFSTGMKQRLGLAFALMEKPDFLILDEPTNGLDPMGIAEFRDIICKLNREYNTTILISSHILGELSQIATVYGFINQGNLVEQVSASELAKKCRRRLAIKVNDIVKAADILKGELSCTYEITEDSRIFVEKYVDAPEVLNETLVKNGVQVFELTTAGLRLEQYFIDLVGGNQNA
jgi:ABC-2 type transport system ATP-binding protein